MSDLIEREYLLNIARKEEAYGYVSLHEILNAPTAEPKGDLIRRDEAIQEIKSFFISILSEMPCNDKDEIIDTALANIFLEFNKGLCVAIKELPTAEPKVGKWLDGERVGYNGIYYYRYCSECLFERNDDDAEKDTPYCPECGAKMERSE